MKRILIHRLGSLGDTLVALPSFRVIRRAFPDAHIVVLTNEPVSGKAPALGAILENTGLADEIIAYPVGLRDPTQILALLRKLRAGRFDLAISLAAPRGRAAALRDYLFLRAAGAGKVAGIPWSLRDRVPQQEPGSARFEPERDRLLRRVRHLGPSLPGDDDPALTQAEEMTADGLLRAGGMGAPFLAASLGTKLPLKDWGAARWSGVLAKVGAAHPGLGLVLVGSADEAPRSEELISIWPGSRLNLCGQATPRVTAAILKRARLFLGNDSGPMHLAAAVGTPCVVVHSANARPGAWFPAGAGHLNLYPDAFDDPARALDPAHQQAALASITVDQVVRAVESKLA